MVKSETKPDRLSLTFAALADPTRRRILASLASGEASLDELGPELSPAAITPLLLPLVDHSEGVVDGEVWWIDTFGNAQTNISPEDLRLAGLAPGGPVIVRVGATEYEMEWRDAYEVEGTGVVHVDSYGMMAVAVPGGRADETFRMTVGMSVGFRSPRAAE